MNDFSSPPIRRTARRDDSSSATVLARFHRCRVLALGCWLLTNATVAANPGYEGEGTSEDRAASAATDRAREIALRGLDWLAKQQQEDGSFAVGTGEQGVTRAPVAMTALAALAFMSGGSTLGRGPHRENVARATEFLLEKCFHPRTFVRVVRTSDGSERDVKETLQYIFLPDDGTSKMHGHGYATLALAQAYGSYRIDASYGVGALEKAKDDQRRLRASLVEAVRLIELSQTRDGGWFYEPGDRDHEGSVTITMIQALRAARDVGVFVNKQTIDDAVKYVHGSQREDDGGFKYSLHSTQHSFALTAAAIATLNATGDYDSRVIERGIEYMLDEDPVLNQDRRFAHDEHPYYARLYAAQAYYFHRDPHLFERWFELVVAEFAGDLDSSGAIGSSNYGKVYSTASACLILLLPDEYLPIFRR